jgi:hypothetical protein
MHDEPDSLQVFRTLVSRRARQSAGQWDYSRRLLAQEAFPLTVERLHRLIVERELPVPVKEQLCLALQSGTQRVQDLDGSALKTLTGLPPAKALRALCVYFGLIEPPASQWPVPLWSSEAIEQAIRQMENPFDLLLESDVASVLDLGAGDLSFASELADRYVPVLQKQHRSLVLHCVDRLHPHSKLGGPLHPEQKRLQALQEQLGPAFGFFGDQDMFHLQNLDDRGKLAVRYTIVTCWAPATPTFAYEPTRLSRAVITEHLRQTKGSFHQTRFEGEPALEVQHGARTLLFPSWKFEILGPLALLSLVAHRGALCVLGAVDAQVFWELVAQLLEDARYRPPDQPFAAENLPEVFGEVYEALERLPLGASISLADLGALRSRLSAETSRSGSDDRGYSFRHVRIRRGATFPGMPASSTARKFSSMSEEAPPWFITLLPDSRVPSFGISNDRV